MIELDDFPFASSGAAMLLAGALEAMSREKGISLREIGRGLGYKQPVVLSHMSSGRVPVPIGKAPAIARAVGLPERDFTLAVLEQRHSEVNWETLMALDDDLIEELTSIAGGALGSLPADVKNILREVVADPRAPKRWLSIAELGPAELLRKLRPHIRSEGINGEDRLAIRSALRSAK